MLYELAKPVVMAISRALWNPAILGVEHVPDHGPVILASNHLAYCDAVFLPGQLRRTVHFLGKSDMFSGSSLPQRIGARIMRGLHVMPVDRSGGSAARSAIDAGTAVLEAGEILGIYPEGTRSPDGRLYRGKTGVARLALATGAPIVPVAMLGAYEAQRGRTYFPRRHPQIRVVLGEPPLVRDLAGSWEGTDDAAVLRGVTEAVMERIQELSGQERSEEYSADVKRRLRAASGRADRPSRRDVSR